MAATYLPQKKAYGTSKKLVGAKPKNLYDDYTNWWEDTTGLNVPNEIDSTPDLSPDAPDVPSIPGFEAPPFPESPELVPYTGNTRVPLSPLYLQTAQQTSQYLKSPAYQQLLSGDPNMELFNQAVVVPANQQLLGTTLPMIAAQQSGGPYGAQYYSGATGRAQQEAIVSTADEINKLRMQYDQQSKQNMLQAAGFLPAASGIASQGTQVRQNNLNRQIDVHYKNQGLSQTEYQNEVQATNYALQVLGMQQNVDYQNSLIDYQNELLDQAAQASLFQMLGSVGGAVLGGTVGGPVGALLGSQVGGAAGTFLGGGGTTANTGATNSLNSALSTYALLNAYKGGSGSGTTDSGTPWTPPADALDWTASSASSPDIDYAYENTGSTTDYVPLGF